MNSNPLQDRMALVTGAGGTMGRAVVDALVAQGCRVAMLDLKREAMRAAEARHGDAVLALGCDIGDEAAVTAAHAQLVRALGRVDILVNNAGVLNNHKLSSDHAVGLAPCLAANLDGALFLSQAVVPA